MRAAPARVGPAGADLLFESPPGPASVRRPRGPTRPAAWVIRRIVVVARAADEAVCRGSEHVALTPEETS